MKYALELQGHGAPNGHTDTSAARLVLSAQPTRAEIRQASLSWERSYLWKIVRDKTHP